MSQTPRDPRQLARDILSGKISIEDLAREQARARGQAVPGAPAQRVPPPIPRPPANSPMPQPMKMNTPAPMQRVPAPIQRRVPPPLPRAQVRAKPIVRNQPQPARGPLQVIVQPAAPSQNLRPERQAVEQPPARPTRSNAGKSLLVALRSRKALKQGILLSEILGPPLALRETERY